MEENNTVCPVCRDVVQLCKINFSEAIYMCMNTQCRYPFRKIDQITFISYKAAGVNIDSYPVVQAEKGCTKLEHRKMAKQSKSDAHTDLLFDSFDIDKLLESPNSYDTNENETQIADIIKELEMTFK